MNTIIHILPQIAFAVLCLVAFALVVTTWSQGFRRPNGLLQLCNVAEGTHEGSKRFLADAAIATRYLLGKPGTDTDHIDICGVADEPTVVIVDEATAAEKEVTGEFLGISPRTVLMVGSEAIAADVDVFTAAAGKIQDLPGVATAVLYRVGRTVTACAADGQQCEVIPCKPEKVAILAALQSTDATAGAAADLAALKAETELLGDDFRRFVAASAGKAHVKFL